MENKLRIFAVMALAAFTLIGTGIFVALISQVPFVAVIMLVAGVFVAAKAARINFCNEQKEGDLLVRLFSFYVLMLGSCTVNGALMGIYMSIGEAAFTPMATVLSVIMVISLCASMVDRGMRKTLKQVVADKGKAADSSGDTAA